MKRRTRSATAAAAVPAPGKRDTRRKELAPDVLARAKKRWWANDPKQEIADEAGVGLSTLYAIAKRERWPKEVMEP